MLETFDFLGKGSLKTVPFEVIPRCLFRVSAETRNLDAVLGMAAAADGLIVGPSRLGADPDGTIRCLALVRTLRPGWPVLVEVGHGGAATIDADLDALMPAFPDGIVLADGPDAVAVQHLGAKLAVREAMLGILDGGTRIMAVAAARAASVPGPRSYVGASSRLVGLVWDQARFADNAVEPRTAPQRLSAPLLLARAAVAIAARAAGMPAYQAGSRLAEAPLRAECRRARRDGFAGKIALDPAQVSLIQAAFDTAPA